MADFTSGAGQIATTFNFMSSFGAIKPDVDDELTRRFGRQRLSGLLDLFGHKKSADNIRYSHFEEDRLYPKIKAANGGAGAAGAAVVFYMRRPTNANLKSALADAERLAGTAS